MYDFFYTTNQMFQLRKFDNPCKKCERDQESLNKKQSQNKVNEDEGGGLDTFHSSRF